MESLVCYHQWALPTKLPNLSLLYKYMEHHGLHHSIDPAGYILVTTAMGVQETTFLRMFPMAELRGERRAVAEPGVRLGEGDTGPIPFF